MRPDQSSAAKRMDLSGLPVILRAEIIRFVKGVRGPRDKEVSLREIQKWCSGTPGDAVKREVNELVCEGKLNIYQNGLDRNRCGFVYGIPEAQSENK